MISIIVPVYKVEPYLDECVKSIADQTYTDIEVILIDDGSPDKCPSICDAWTQKDARIKVIHKKNGGLSDARNAGLRIAKGEYIAFIDSDDYIAPTMLEELLSKLIETDSEISACGVEMLWEDGKSECLTSNFCGVLNNYEAMDALLSESYLKQPVWYKLYKRSVVEGIYFEAGKCHEDVFFSYLPISRAKRVCVFDTPLYYYRQRNDSIMGESFSPKRIDALEGKERRLDFIKNNYPSLVCKAQNDIFLFSLYLGQMALRDGTADKKILKTIGSYAGKYPLIPSGAKDKIWLMLSKVSFKATCKVRNLLQIGV